MKSSERMKIQGNTPRKTIGMLTDWLYDQYQFDLLYGINDLAMERDVNLLCFEGGRINATTEYEARGNIVYDLVSRDNVNGLVILDSIGNLVSFKSIVEFCKHYQPIPMVMVGHKLPGIPSLVIDNQGIRELVLHLIQVHHHQNFAFIQGPESNFDGIQRYDTFVKTLAEYNIPVNPQLIVRGDFNSPSGVEAIRILYDERRVHFDAIIAANGNMATGAMAELKARGIKVPEEVAVAGFDNFDICSFASPPLTTIGYSIYEYGRRAGEILLDIIAGKPVPQLETIPTKLIVRQSCGCSSQLTVNASVDETRSKPNQEWPLQPIGNADLQPAVARFSQKIQPLFSNVRRMNIPEISQKLFGACFKELNGGESGASFKAWNEVLDFSVTINEDLATWQTVLSELRQILIPFFPDFTMRSKMENLLQQVRMMINEKAVNREMFEHNELIQISNALGSLREKLLATMDEEKAMNILSETLPGLDVKSCYIVMFEGKRHARSKLILAYDEYGRKNNLNEATYFGHKLLPKRIIAGDRRATMLVSALNFTQPQLGFTIFETGLRDGEIYSEMRRIIYSTMQSAILYKKMQEQANRLRIQKERLSTNLEQLNKVMSGFIQAIALTVETRDPYTAGHQRRVAELATAIATEMQLSWEQIESIRMAGIIHDLGKIYVPSDILNKPGRLSDLEFSFIQSHPEVAYHIIENIDFPWPIAQIILQHHEKIDGTGYPNGLKGGEIKLEARIMVVADVVESMLSHRPYRAAPGLNKALAEIEEKRGILYEPEAVDICLKLFREKGFEFIDYAMSG
jgi:HD-GYP domain-containing protein (c-di-GMP phosphodiesterase class II)/DNA-binding LacI/PurR family transcriptional regulator